MPRLFTASAAFLIADTALRIGAKLNLFPTRVRAALEDAYAALSERAKPIGEARDFDQLFNIVGAAVDDIPGLGELYVYGRAPEKRLLPSFCPTPH